MNEDTGAWGVGAPEEGSMLLLDLTGLLGTGAMIAALAYLGTAAIKQALHRAGWLEHPRTADALRILPMAIGAFVALYWWPTLFINVAVEGQVVPLPTVVVGLLAGRSSEAGYLWMRERAPWLDPITLPRRGPARAPTPSDSFHSDEDSA